MTSTSDNHTHINVRDGLNETVIKMEFRIWCRNSPDYRYLYEDKEGPKSITEAALEYVSETVAQHLAEAGKQPISTWVNTDIETWDAGEKRGIF